MKLVVIESPYSWRNRPGTWWLFRWFVVWMNVAYLRRCMRDCLLRGEAPYASHGLYTQPGVLDDDIPNNRSLGMIAGFEWGARADYAVVYADRGFSDGMRAGIDRHRARGLRVEYRSLKTGIYRVDEATGEPEKAKS